MTKHEQITWRTVVNSFYCETCMAGPGDPCRTVSGHRKYEPHAPRARRASAHNWEDPEDEATWRES